MAYNEPVDVSNATGTLPRANGGTGTDISNPSNTLNNQGFSIFGEYSPTVKMAILTGTTAGFAGGSATVTLTGVDVTKVVGFVSMVGWTANGNFTPQGYAPYSVYSYACYNDDNGGNPRFWIDGIGANLVSQPFTILVWYKL